MRKTNRLHDAIQSAIIVNQALLTIYRQSTGMLHSPSVVRLAQSIIDRKIKQIEDANAAATAVPEAIVSYDEAPTPTETAIDEKGFLVLVHESETMLARWFLDLSEATPEEECRYRLRQLSDTSAKFATWVQDQIELTALF